MTVSVNSTMEFSRDEIIAMAYQLCGILEAGKPAPAEDLAMASNFMNMELQALQAEGVVLRTQVRSLLTLTSGAAAYTLPADTIDVQLGPNDQVGTIVPVISGSETLVMTMSRAEYLDLANKTSSTGRPTRAYVEKQASVTVTLWPVPDATVASLRYTQVRLLRDADTGAVTIDLARRWLKYVTYATAAHVGRAKSIPNESINDLQNQAERMKAVCLAEDGQRGKIRFRLAHSGRRW